MISSGIAVYNGNEIDMVKVQGGLKVLNEPDPLTGNPSRHSGNRTYAMRATHGSPSDITHPHFNKDKSIVVVHNGIIENSPEVKEKVRKVMVMNSYRRRTQR